MSSSSDSDEDDKGKDLVLRVFPTIYCNFVIISLTTHFFIVSPSDESPIIKQSEASKKQRQSQKPSHRNNVNQEQMPAQQPPQKRRAIQMTELTVSTDICI